MGLETVHLFHGTYKKNAMSIIQRGFTTTDIPDIGKINTGNAKKKPGSLGFGLYGFRDDPCLALDYIKRVCTGNDYEVLHFDIQLHRDNKLNFVNSVNDMMAFQQWKELPARKKLLDILKKKYSNNVKQHSLDGAILEAYIYDMTRRKEFKEPIYAVCSATHTPTNPESENRSISMIPNGIEYAVRNTIIINNDSIDTVGTSSNQLEE